MISMAKNSIWTVFTYMHTIFGQKYPKPAIVLNRKKIRNSFAVALLFFRWSAEGIEGLFMLQPNMSSNWGQRTFQPQKWWPQDLEATVSIPTSISQLLDLSKANVVHMHQPQGVRVWCLYLLQPHLLNPLADLMTGKKIFQIYIGILFSKLYLTTVRKNDLVIEKNFWNSRLKADGYYLKSP